MKSAVFYGKNEISVEQWPRPKVGADEVLVQIMACGVCGSDVHLFEGDKASGEVLPPRILGHEFSGVIVEVGSAVTALQIGARVCVDPNNSCGACEYCRCGEGHFCTNRIVYGVNADGGFAEYCKVHVKQVYTIAQTVSFEEAAMAEPISCCMHGMDLCDVRPGNTVLILGGGMIGLIMLQLARLAGAGRVILLEPVAGKREMARKLGADLTIDPIHEDVKLALAANGVGRIHAVIECCGLKATVAQAMELVSNQGTVMLFGLTRPDDTVALKPFSIFQKETTIRASYINPYTTSRAVALLNSRRLDVSSMICGTIPLERLTEVLSDAALRTNGKYIVAPGMAMG